MDRQTDIQNYDSQDRASIAASRGKKLFQYNCDDYYYDYYSGHSFSFCWTSVIILQYS